MEGRDECRLQMRTVLCRLQPLICGTRIGVDLAILEQLPYSAPNKSFENRLLQQRLAIGEKIVELGCIDLAGVEYIQV
jgi:hypothetical protein